MSSKSELAEAKKQAEVESDEFWAILKDTMISYMAGYANKNTLEAHFDDFELAHNTERGLRHEN